MGAALIVLAGCRPGFQPRQFGNDHARLYAAALAQFEQKRWDNAIAGFERLTIELPARDPLLPLSIYHLAEAHLEKKQFLLAAQTFVRVAETFPLDTLSDESLFRAGRAYAELWRKPSLDPQYGETARSTLETMLAVYPESPMAEEARRELAALNDKFAQKIYNNGMFYMRRNGNHSAVIYFREVVETYPETPTAKAALLRMVEAFREENWREDAEETCATLHGKYPSDQAVRTLCGVTATTATTPQ
ncbi:MAG TPA: outer membrane protein assembly factor BamD [Gemmatimonadaceae bacterium]|nr:outer membrane protein assembly factor BamD [Gemmatimonadaceae bacterium]